MKMIAGRWSKVAAKAQQQEKEKVEETLSNLENAEPELCINLLRFPSVQNFSGLKKKIASCSEEWMVGFLDQDGLAVLFTTLERLSNDTMRGSKSALITSMELLHCVGCVKSVMNSRTGLDYVISREDYTRMLSTTLGSTNVMVKKQVFELLAAMCIYSADGKVRAIDAMEHYKHARSQRYRFSVVLNELRAAENIPYQTGILSFINAAILSTESLHDRMQMRNEFIGLQLLDIMTELRHSETEDLLIQIDVFDERKLEDEEEIITYTGAEGIDINDHKDVFLAVFNKVCNSPQANHLLTILQCLLQLSPDDKISDVAWEVLDTMVQRTVIIESVEEGKRLLKHRESAAKKRTLSSNMKDNYVQTDVMLSDSVFSDGVTSESSEPASTPSSPRSIAGTVPPPPPIGGIPPPPPIGGIPPPPPIGGIPPPPPIGGIPPPPPPIGGIPPPPPIGGIPPPPPIGGIPPPPPIGGIPPPPPIGGIPPPPPVGGVPPPPPPIGGIPPPPPIGGIPPPPPIGGIPPPPPAGGVPPPPGIVPVYASQAYAAPAVRRSASVPKPTAKLRKFNWQKIPQGTLKKRSNSVWESLENGRCDVEPDYMNIQELFSQKVFKKKPAKETKKAAPTEVTLIDSRRSMNIGIFLRQFKKPNEEIIKALKEGNREVMTEEKLRNMLKFLPESTEIEMINSFPGDKSTLANVERYFLLLSKVSHYQLRIEAGIARESFEEDMEDLTPTIRNVKKACRDIRNCKKLEDFLVLILKTGNFMNFGGHSGDAHGFKITSLLNLAETKANKPRMTLLHCVVMEAESKNPELLALPQDLVTVIKCKTVSIEQLRKDIGRLTGVINKLKKQVEKASKDVNEQFGPFLKEAIGRIAEFDDDMKEIEKLGVELAEYLVEDAQKFKLEDCISTFAKFAEQVASAIKENKERAIAEEKKKKREAMEEERKKQGGGKKKGFQPPPQGENIIDNLLSDIRKGFNLKKSSTLTRKTSTASNSKSTNQDSPSRSTNDVTSETKTSVAEKSIKEAPDNNKVNKRRSSVLTNHKGTPTKDQSNDVTPTDISEKSDETITSANASIVPSKLPDPARNNESSYQPSDSDPQSEIPKPDLPNKVPDSDIEIQNGVPHLISSSESSLPQDAPESATEIHADLNQHACKDNGAYEPDIIPEEPTLVDENQPDPSVVVNGIAPDTTKDVTSDSIISPDNVDVFVDDVVGNMLEIEGIVVKDVSVDEPEEQSAPLDVSNGMIVDHVSNKDSDPLDADPPTAVNGTDHKADESAPQPAIDKLMSFLRISDNKAEDQKTSSSVDDETPVTESSVDTTDGGNANGSKPEAEENNTEQKVDEINCNENIIVSKKKSNDAPVNNDRSNANKKVLLIPKGHTRPSRIPVSPHRITKAPTSSSSSVTPTSPGDRKIKAPAHSGAKETRNYEKKTLQSQAVAKDAGKSNIKQSNISENGTQLSKSMQAAAKKVRNYPKSVENVETISKREKVTTAGAQNSRNLHKKVLKENTKTKKLKTKPEPNPSDSPLTFRRGSKRGSIRRSLVRFVRGKRKSPAADPPSSQAKSQEESANTSRVKINVEKSKKKSKPRKIIS